MKKILLLALLVLGQLIFADSINSWCAVDGKVIENLQDDTFFRDHSNINKRGFHVAYVSTLFNEDILKKIRERYKDAHYNIKYLRGEIERDWRLKEGFWFTALNSIFIQNLDTEKEWKYSDSKYIVDTILLVGYKKNRNYIKYLKKTDESILSDFAFAANSGMVYINPAVSLVNIYVSMDDPNNKKLDEQKEELKKILREKAGICR